MYSVLVCAAGLLCMALGQNHDVIQDYAKGDAPAEPLDLIGTGPTGAGPTGAFGANPGGLPGNGAGPRIGSNADWGGWGFRPRGGAGLPSHGGDGHSVMAFSKEHEDKDVSELVQARKEQEALSHDMKHKISQNNPLDPKHPRVSLEDLLNTARPKEDESLTPTPEHQELVEGEHRPEHGIASEANEHHGLQHTNLQHTGVQTSPSLQTLSNNQKPVVLLAIFGAAFASFVAFAKRNSRTVSTSQSLLG